MTTREFRNWGEGILICCHADDAAAGSRDGDGISKQAECRRQVLCTVTLWRRQVIHAVDRRYTR
jgi:hypothetical protein